MKKMMNKVVGIIGLYIKSPKKSNSLDFNEIYRNNMFGGDESVSGSGSSMHQTELLRKDLQLFLNNYNIKKFLDLPCGDFNWMKAVNFDGIDYLGGDIIIDLISRNQKQFGSENHRFVYLDIMSSILPTADVIFCRDCFVHFNYKQIFTSIRNIKRSNIQYLMTTTFTKRENVDLKAIWRPVNLQKPPFNFPAPIDIINEGCTEENGIWSDKSIGVWRICDLNDIYPQE